MVCVWGSACRARTDFCLGLGRFVGCSEADADGAVESGSVVTGGAHVGPCPVYGSADSGSRRIGITGVGVSITYRVDDGATDGVYDGCRCFVDVDGSSIAGLSAFLFDSSQALLEFGDLGLLFVDEAVLFVSLFGLSQHASLLFAVPFLDTFPFFLFAQGASGGFGGVNEVNFDYVVVAQFDGPPRVAEPELCFCFHHALGCAEFADDVVIAASYANLAECGDGAPDTQGADASD